MTNSAPGTDMLSPIRYVATALEDARLSGRAVSVQSLADNYEHSVSGDMSRFRTYSGANNDQDAIRWVIGEAIKRLGDNVVEADGEYALSKPMAAIRYERKRLVALRPTSAALRALYGLRKSIGSLDTLVASMKEEGWREELGDVVKDQDTGIILSGNRRLLAAKKAGVEPKIVVRSFADDYHRLRFARNMNAQKPLTKDENVAALRLLKDIVPELTVREIAEETGVPKSTVHRVLAGHDEPSTGLSNAVPNGTRKSSRNVTASYPPEAIPGLPFSLEQVDEFERRAVDGGEAKATVAKDMGLGKGGRAQVSTGKLEGFVRGGREARATLPHCPTCTCS